MDETALAAQFAHIDAIKDVVIMRNRATGQSKGFGFITFASRVGQQRAMAEMDGQFLEGPDGTRRKCSVNPAVRLPLPRSPFPPHEGKLVTDHNCLQEPRVRPLKRGPTDRLYAPRGPGPGRGGHGNAGRQASPLSVANVALRRRAATSASCSTVRLTDVLSLWMHPCPFLMALLHFNSTDTFIHAEQPLC